MPDSAKNQMPHLISGAHHASTTLSRISIIAKATWTVSENNGWQVFGLGRGVPTEVGITTQIHERYLQHRVVAVVIKITLGRAVELQQVPQAEAKCETAQNDRFQVHQCTRNTALSLGLVSILAPVPIMWHLS